MCQTEVVNSCTWNQHRPQKKRNQLRIHVRLVGVLAESVALVELGLYEKRPLEYRVYRPVSTISDGLPLRVTGFCSKRGCKL